MPKTPCPHCGAVLKLPEKYAAASARCPKCQKPFELPAQSGEPGEAPRKPAAIEQQSPAIKCAKCGGTEDLLSGRFHAAMKKYVSHKRKRHFGDHSETTTITNYEGVLNTSDWVCAPCIMALEKEHRRVGWTAIGFVVAGLIAWYFVPLERHSIASYLRGGVAIIAGMLVPIFAAVLWFTKPDAPNMADSFALRCNKRKLRQQGYKHFGTGHMQTDHQQVLAALRR